jgi:hypothetical protein
LQRLALSPPVADRYDVADDNICALKAHKQAVAAPKATRCAQDVSPGEYVAIVVTGGKGTTFDLPSDSALATLPPRADLPTTAHRLLPSFDLSSDEGREATGINHARHNRVKQY